MTIREQIFAAAKEAGIKLVPFVVDGNEYDFCDVEMDTSETLERFYAIAHEAGAASRDAEIADLTKQREELEFSLAGCSQQLKDACADLDAVEQERDELRAQVLAQQARIEQLANALSRFRDNVLFRIGSASPYRDIAQEYFDHIKGLLETTDDLSALRAHDEKLLKIIKQKDEAILQGNLSLALSYSPDAIEKGGE